MRDQALTFDDLHLGMIVEYPRSGKTYIVTALEGNAADCLVELRRIRQSTWSLDAGSLARVGLVRYTDPFDEDDQEATSGCRPSPALN